MYCDVNQELAALEERAGHALNPAIREFMAYCLETANKAYDKGFYEGARCVEGVA